MRAFRVQQQKHVSQFPVPPHSNAAGKNAACVAVARMILEINYHMIRDDTHFVTERNREEIKKRSVKRLESLGYAVTIEDAA